MKQDDCAQFIKAMQKEIADHTSKGHWKVIQRDQVPQGYLILPAVWSMK